MVLAASKAVVAQWSGWDGSSTRSRRAAVLGPTSQMQLVWNVSNPSAVSGSNVAISADGETVLAVSSNSSSRASTLFAYNSTNGDLLYQTNLNDSPVQQLLIDSLPDFHAIAVFNCSIVATSKGGTQLWQWNACNGTKIIDAQIAASLNAVVAITANTSMWWLDVVSGGVLRMTNGGTNATAASVTLSNDLVVITVPRKSVAAYTMADGAPIWNSGGLYLQPTQSSIFSDDRRLLLVLNGSSPDYNPPNVICLNASDGSVVWKASSGSALSSGIYPTPQARLV